MRILRLIVHACMISVFGSAVGVVSSAQAQSLPFTIGFPIKGENPYTALIGTVIDHSTPYFYDKNWTMVQAYTGEMGQEGAEADNRQCGPSGDPCGFYNANFKPRNSSDSNQFIVNGNYVGANADCTSLSQPPDCLEKYKVLNYRGHPGYDYRYELGRDIVAPADGFVHVPAHDPINSRSSDPWCTYHTFFIDHGNGWTTWYLHADTLTVGTPHACTNGPQTVIPADEVFNVYVKKGQTVAKVGNYCSVCEKPLSPHLHFEVRRGGVCANELVPGCKVVDPYGWEWIGIDPIRYVKDRFNSDITVAAAQTAPLWNLADWGTQMPVVTGVTLAPSSDGYLATISGSNFASGAKVTMWLRGGYYWAATLPATADPVTPTEKISVDLPSTTISDPTQYVLKVRNPVGPRSPAVTLSLTGPSSSVPLIISGTPAPGGGTFDGFAGFESVTNRGETVFSSGVDLNGDGTPDQFADFMWLAGQITRISVPGFTNVSSVGTHVRVNNEGDMAFGDVNGQYGATPAAIYLLPSGSSSPIEITGYGKSCPSPCPVSGPVTVYAPYGPLAMSDAGDITFTTSLLNPQSQTALCCYFYVYRAASNSVNLIAADGPTGTPTPIGGTFSTGTLDQPRNEFTSDGDVILQAHVSGSVFQSGIFRYSKGALSKVVAQGDTISGPVGGTLQNPLMGDVCSVSGRRLVFHSAVTGGSSPQVIGLVGDVTQNASPSFTIVAYEGENTGTTAGGSFGPNLPFGGYGQNTAPPCVRADGLVIFHSLLTGATAQDGSPTDQGVFLWSRGTFQKLVVDGDPAASGKSVQGVFAPVANDIGEVYYFVSRLQ